MKTYQVEELTSNTRKVIHSFEDIEMAFQGAIDHSIEIQRQRSIIVTEKDQPDITYLFIGGVEGI